MAYVPPHMRKGSKLKLPSAVMPAEEEGAKEAMSASTPSVSTPAHL